MMKMQKFKKNKKRRKLKCEREATQDPIAQEHFSLFFPLKKMRLTGKILRFTL